MELNEQQKEAVEHLDGPCLVVSVPGSGKTRVLTTRVIRLIEKGISQQNIVCVTFTNKAANEMKSRIHQQLGQKPKCFIGTFHKFCVGILRRFGERIGYSSNFSIVDSNDQKDLVLQTIRRLGKVIDKSEVFSIIKAVNNLRENLWDQDELEEALEHKEDLVQVANKYINYLKSTDSIDFSGLQSETSRLLEDNPDVLQTIQEVVKYLSIDESHDTNIVQFHLINLFAGKWKNIFLIADPSQSIYRFRGSRYQNIQDFLVHYPNCRRLELPLNYRSTPQIIKVADTLIRHNESHMAKEFVTNNLDGEEVRCLAFTDQIQEAQFVAQHCKNLIQDGGWKPNDIAVLYRVNAMSEQLERAFTSARVEYEVIGGFSFYDRAEIKDCIAILRFISNPKDGIAFHRISKFVDGLGDKTIGQIESIALSQNVDIIEAVKRYSQEAPKRAQDALKTVLDRLSIDKTNLIVNDCLSDLIERFDVEKELIGKYGTEDGLDRMENVRQLINAAGEYVVETGDKSVEGYLQTVALMSAYDKESKEGRVSLMSLHASKGLEFGIVFLAGFEQGIIPHYLALQGDDIKEQLEEESRLAYVGMTRAKNLLIITHCKNRKQFGRGGASWYKKCIPSQFLFESGLLKENYEKHKDSFVSR